MKNLFWSILCMVMFGFAALACSDDDNNGKSDNENGTETGGIIADPDTTNVLTSAVFILNQGNWGGNNSSIVRYSPETKSGVTDIYFEANGRYAGDTGQDLTESCGSLYLSVFGSKYIAKLDTDGLERSRYSFTAEDGDPRCLVVEGENLYVSSYSGEVLKFDTATMEKNGSVTVGMNPESMAVMDDQLLVVNSGWGADSTMSVIDLPSFTVTKTVTISSNPQKVTVCGGKVFTLSYDVNYNLLMDRVDIERERKEYICDAAWMEPYEGELYLINTVTDWSTSLNTNSFFSYNPATGIVNETSFLKNVPDRLSSSSSSISMFKINPANGEFYIAVSDFVTNSDIYRFSADGHLIDTFDAGGITSYQAVFLQ